MPLQLAFSLAGSFGRYIYIAAFKVLFFSSEGFKGNCHSLAREIGCASALYFGIEVLGFPGIWLFVLDWRRRQCSSL